MKKKNNNKKFDSPYNHPKFHFSIKKKQFNYPPKKKKKYSQMYKTPLETECKIISSKDVSSIFSNIDQILGINSTLLQVKKKFFFFQLNKKKNNKKKKKKTGISKRKKCGECCQCFQKNGRIFKSLFSLLFKPRHLSKYCGTIRK